MKIAILTITSIIAWSTIALIGAYDGSWLKRVAEPGDAEVFMCLACNYNHVCKDLSAIRTDTPATFPIIGNYESKSNNLSIWFFDRSQQEPEL